MRRDDGGLHKAFEALGRVRVQAEVAALEDEAELLMLRGDKQTVPPFEAVVIRANRGELACEQTDSDSDWTATVPPKPEHWRFVRAELPETTREIRVEFTCKAKAKVSVWLWEKRSRPDGPRNLPDLLPAPEYVSVRSACLFLHRKRLKALQAPKSAAGKGRLLLKLTSNQYSQRRRLCPAL